MKATPVFNRVVRVFAAAALCVSGSMAWAQSYPQKPIQIVVPYQAGGGADATARMVGTALGKAFGETVVVDPRPGGATIPGTTHVARSAADGYTLLLTGGSTMVLQPLTFEGTLPYDPLKDFDPVGMISRIPLFLAVPSSSPYKTLDDLLKDAKTKPDAIAYAHNGVGSLAHLGTELLAKRAGVKFTPVPYKSFAAAAPDLRTGRVNMIMSDLAGLNALLQDDSVRLLGVSSTERPPFHSEVPTIAELGFPGYEIEVWLALHAPAGTPPEALEALSRELSAFLKTDEAKETLGKLGHIADPSGGDVVRQRIKNELESLGPVVKDVGLR